MDLRLVLDYHPRLEEQRNFLDQVEQDTLATLEAGCLDMVRIANGSPTALQTVKLAEIRQTFLTAHINRCCSRISTYLLRTAMGFKYGDKMPRTEGGRMPGKWWGHLQETMDEAPEMLQLTPNQAAWIVDVWLEEKVQNSWPPGLQKWVNVFEEEVLRLKTMLENPKAELVEVVTGHQIFQEGMIIGHGAPTDKSMP